MLSSRSSPSLRLLRSRKAGLRLRSIRIPYANLPARPASICGADGPSPASFLLAATAATAAGSFSRNSSLEWWSLLGPTFSSASRDFSTKAKGATGNKVKATDEDTYDSGIIQGPTVGEVQKMLWNSYLASGRGGKELFASIDTSRDGKVSKAEVCAFLDAVDRHGAPARAFRLLKDRAVDHELDLKEFLSWLVLATKLSYHPSGRIKESYEAHPETQTRSAAVAAARAATTPKVADDESADAETEYSWNESTMSQSLRRMQYAVRGEIVMKAETMLADGRQITFTNIGNPHSVGQKPITYYREVLALCDLPASNGVDHPDITRIFPADVVERAREMRKAIGPCGTGAYTHSQGVAAFRQHVADFIEARDGHPAYCGDIFLTNGASSGIQSVMTALIACDRDAIMIPIPQYPIYSALIALLGGRQVGYELDEGLGWAVTREELERRLEESKRQGLEVKALALINPGNPTGQLLNREALEVMCKFCAENGIVLLADEVYQRNVYVEDKEFISTKKIAVETPGCENLQLISFHSTSKGLIGECGRRGGYMELHGIDPYVQAQLYKLVSSGLCSGVAGQIMTSLMVKPPLPGDDSFDLFTAEENGIFDSLRWKAQALVEGLNDIDGIQCERAEGAMYAFPRVTLPQRAIEEAEANHQTPDTLYALSLLEETGICVVPASGFGQAEGRIGFRTTFLPPEDQLMEAIKGFATHHKLFCEKYS